jgi:hypothetical protein
MRQLVRALALLVLAAPPSFAGAILYATAASEQRIDGFCLNPDGSLHGSTGSKRFETSSAKPRRLLVAEDVITTTNPDMTGDVLYAALERRVQTFRISRRGWLDGIGSTREQEFVDPRDLVVSPGKNRLYVAQHGLNRIVAYEIDRATGLPSDDLSSCAIGRGDAQYVSLAIGPNPNPSSVMGAFLLYASSEGDGRVDVYPLDPNGDILETETDEDGNVVLDPPSDQCPGGPDPPCGRPKIKGVSPCRNEDEERPRVTQPLSSRPGLGQPKSIILDGEMLYVEQRFRKRISAFRLKDGLFCDSEAQCPGFDVMGSDKCKRKQQKRIENEKPPRQCPADRTPESSQYEDVVKFRQTLIGTQFFKNRVDVYRLKEPGDPKGPLPGKHGESEVDVRMTPVRATAISILAIRGECSDTDPARPCGCPEQDKCGALYVAAGSLDRVSAYALGANGKMSRTPFSTTSEQKGSFPNDVAVAVLPDSCLE